MLLLYVWRTNSGGRCTMTNSNSMQQRQQHKYSNTERQQQHSALLIVSDIDIGYRISISLSDIGYRISISGIVYRISTLNDYQGRYDTDKQKTNRYNFDIWYQVHGSFRSVQHLHKKRGDARRWRAKTRLVRYVESSIRYIEISILIFRYIGTFDTMSNSTLYTSYTLARVYSAEITARTRSTLCYRHYSYWFLHEQQQQSMNTSSAIWQCVAFVTVTIVLRVSVINIQKGTRYRFLYIFFWYGIFRTLIQLKNCPLR